MGYNITPLLSEADALMYIEKREKKNQKKENKEELKEENLEGVKD